MHIPDRPSRSIAAVLATTAVAAGLLLGGPATSRGNAETADARLVEWVELQAELSTRLRAGDPDAVSLAEELFGRTVQLFGRRHPKNVDATTLLARAYQLAGKPLTARPYFMLALKLSEELLGPDDPGTAIILNFIGNVDLELGDTESARKLLERSVSIMEGRHGPDSLETAHVLRGLAGVRFAMGDLDETALLLARIVAIHEELLGTRHPDTAEVYNNLAHVLNKTERFKQAQALMEKALAIHRGLPGYDLKVADDLNGLGMILLGMGDADDALPHLEQALEIYQKHHPGGHSDTASVLSSIGYALSDLQRYAEAEAAFLQALEMARLHLGDEHPSLACTLNGLLAIPTESDAALSIDGLSEAFGRMLPTLDPWQTESAIAHGLGVTLNAEACIDLAFEAPEKALQKLSRVVTALDAAFGADSPQLMRPLVNLALALDEMGRSAEAVAPTARALEIQEKTLADIMARGALEEAENFLDTVDWDTRWALTLQLRASNKEAARLGLTTVLRRKGRDLETRARPQGARDDPEIEELTAALQQTREKWAFLHLHGDASVISSSETSDLLTSRIRLLGSEVRKVQQRLGEGLPPSITVEAVQGHLPESTALVEMVFFDPVETFAAGSRTAPRYLAYVLRRDGEPTWADLGEAAAIDRAVAAFRLALDGDIVGVRQQARRLDALTMAPLRPLLGRVDTLLLSPDGALNLVPFAALVDPAGSYLVERYLLTYLSSGRDLLEARDVPSREPPLVLGNPRFGTESPIAFAGFNFPSLEPLPGTAREVANIAKTLALGSSRALLGSAARESAVKGAHGPKILHLATHGFFFDDQPDPSTPSAPRGTTLDPLLRSGLFLSNPHSVTPADDSILTAAEAMDLDLAGTEIVTLSACETGIGEIRPGRGVYGLRRALVLSGARSQVMSLWRIDDRVTAALMASFYNQIAAGEPRGKALRRIQLAALADGPLPRTRTRLPRGVRVRSGLAAAPRHPYFWAGFILAGDTGPLTE